MRWQPFAVAAGLAAPPVALALAVWPSSSDGRGGFDVDPEAELAAGDSDRGSTNGLSSTDYLILGGGTLRIDVDGPTFDPTLTLVDPDTGEQLDYNDDSDGLNPSLVVELDDGDAVLAQVRSLGGPPGGAFTISVVDTGDGGAGADGVVPTTVAGAAGAVEPFTEPIGDEPVELAIGRYTIRLREDANGVCLEIESPSGGSGSCSSSLQDLVQPGGFGGSFDGRTSTIEVASLVGPEVATAIVLLLDETEITLDVAPLPGRSEQVVVGEVRMAGDVFNRPGGSGAVLVLRDADGEQLASYPV